MISLTMPYKVIPTNTAVFKVLAKCQPPTVNCHPPTGHIHNTYTVYIQLAVGGLCFQQLRKLLYNDVNMYNIHNTPKQVVMTLFFLLGRSEYCSNGHSYFRWLLLLILWDTGVMRNNVYYTQGIQNTLVSISTSEEKCYQTRLLHFKIYQLFNLVWLKVWILSIYLYLSRQMKIWQKIGDPCLPSCSLKYVYGHFMNIRAHSGTTNTFKHCINHQVEACTYYVTIEGAHAQV